MPLVLFEQLCAYSLMKILRRPCCHGSNDTGDFASILLEMSHLKHFDGMHIVFSLLFHLIYIHKFQKNIRDNAIIIRNEVM